MEIINNFAPGATLTTEHSASSHGIPVLVINGIAYGPQDSIRGDEDEATAWMMPNIQTGADLVREFALGHQINSDLRAEALKYLGNTTLPA